ncbi:MAG: rhamnulose-1-phosphate aldolase [Clostridia bacterium]|nr:rhamnulose-1-phosphate aldolase [Clostridia bacterium]
MKNILDAPFLAKTVRTITEMYRLGWDERNGGNISLLLDEAEVKDYVDITKVLRTITTGFEAPDLDGRYFLVTSTGSYFRNIQYQPEKDLGLLRLADGGRTAELLWGYKGGGKFTSEFAAHILSHTARLSADPENRVIMHSHPANLIAMTYVHDLDEREFTRTLWRMETECMIVFPDGVKVLPWMLCGTNEIGQATAEKMKTARLVIWAQHGIYGAGKDLDEAFGLIETADKAAEIYLKIAHLPVKQTLTDEDLRLIAGHFGGKIREGWLD